MFDLSSGKGSVSMDKIEKITEFIYFRFTVNDTVLEVCDESNDEEALNWTVYQPEEE